MISIDTDRLIVREHRIEDLEDYHVCVSNPEVMRYIIGFNQTKSFEESRVKLMEAVDSISEIPRDKFFLAVILKDTAGYIGSVGGTITRMEENGGIMAIGYFLNKLFWNRGYATEATRAWIDHVFTNFGIHRIFASCNSRNSASERVMQKCGMERESLLRMHRYEEGCWHDELQYAVLREHWRA